VIYDELWFDDASGEGISLTNSELSSAARIEVNRRVAPRRRPNAEVRSRERLTPTEVDAMIEAAKKGRHGHRGATAILVASRHGLRAAELCDLRWDQIDFGGAVLHVRRVKNGTPSTHPIQGDELRSLRRLRRESKPSPYIFVSERGGAPFTTAGFARMVERAARRGLGLELKAHPHMLRHACGYALAQQGARYQGNPGMARPSVDHEHRSLYGPGATSVQGFLERMSAIGRVFS
jgi:type 1 fimbriae regulatory protein FimB/type 1 fimbriae regulatory protein FimE